MNSYEIKDLQNSHYRYLNQIKKIEVDNKVIKEIKDEHVFFTESIINRMVKERTLHRVDKMLSLHKRITVLMHVLFSSSDSLSNFVDTVDKKYMKIDDDKKGSGGGEGCSIEEALEELSLLDF